MPASKRKSGPKLERTSTGIPGLDKLMEGGFVKNSVNMVTGGTGVGKTIFGLQYIWAGLKKGEPGLYITLEESPEDLKADVKQFGWNFDKYEKSGKCEIVYIDPVQSGNLASSIMSEIKSIEAKRLVIDSTSVVGLTIGSPIQLRRKLIGLVNAIKRQKNCTAILISEVPEGEKTLSRFSVEEFVADSVIKLNYLEFATGDLDRSLIIRKMRKTGHGKDVYPMAIKKDGITVKKS